VRPSKCQAPNPTGETGAAWPNTQTSPGLITAAPPIGRPKARATVQARPFQCRARDRAPPVVNAQTSLAEVAAAVMTTSSRWPGNETRVQDDPLRRQAVGLGSAPGVPLPNAQPPFGPVATTALKSSPGTFLTTCQDGLLARVGCAMLARP